MGVSKSSVFAVHTNKIGFQFLDVILESVFECKPFDENDSIFDLLSVDASSKRMEMW